MSINPHTDRARALLVKKFGSLALAGVHLSANPLSGSQLLRMIQAPPGSVDPPLAVQIELHVGIDLNKAEP